jgi:hypothetical protein
MRAGCAWMRTHVYPYSIRLRPVARRGTKLSHGMFQQRPHVTDESRPGSAGGRYWRKLGSEKGRSNLSRLCGNLAACSTASQQSTACSCASVPGSGAICMSPCLQSLPIRRLSCGTAAISWWLRATRSALLICSDVHIAASAACHVCFHVAQVMPPSPCVRSSSSVTGLLDITWRTLTIA